MFNFGKPQLLRPERAVQLLSWVAGHLPGEEVDSEFRQTVLKLHGRARDDFLRRFYLDLESRLLASGDPEFSDTASFRAQLRERFGIRDVMPSPFSMLFLGRAEQLFVLLRLLLEGIWDRLGWQEEARLGVIGEAITDTPLAALRTFRDGEWRNAYASFWKLKGRQRENAVLGAFQRAVERTYREVVKERGEARARILVEEVVRGLETDFSTTDALSGILVVLPPEVLPDERIALAPREELAQAVTRQTREMQGKNIALAFEAKKLQETIRDLRAAKEQAEAMASAQQDFITVVSHQFRTPLAAIRWQAEALRELTQQQPETAGFLEMADTILERSIFLIGVLENIFDLLAIDSGRFALQSTMSDLSLVCGSLCEEYRKEATRRGLTLACACEALPEFYFDPQAVSRVLNILLTNAIQYSSQGGVVELRAQRIMHPERGAEVLVSVSDQGIGIRSEDRPRIFEKFFRGHNAVMKVPNGAGIANYIAKRIVEFHGGRMWVESGGTGLGSTFYFTIPEPGAMPEGDSAK